MKDIINIKVEIERGIDTPRAEINDLIKEFVFKLNCIPMVNVTKHDLIGVEFK